MKRAYYDTKPTAIAAVGNGNHLYRWDIREEQVQSGIETGETVTQYSCNEVTIQGTPTYDKCVEAVIRHSYTAEQEMALVNKYNSFTAGISQDEEAVPEYYSYLQFVFDTKMMVRHDLDQEEQLSLAKKKKINEISVYDKSEAVNQFTLNGMPVWLDKDTRSV